MKNKNIIIGSLTVLFLLLIAVYLFLVNKSKPPVTPNPSVPVYTTPEAFDKKNLVPSQSFQQQMQFQTQADYNFGQWQQDIYTKYPWYNKLPLASDNYFVYFDVNEKKFIGKIYASPDQTQFFMNQVNFELTSLGINLNQFPIQWQK